MQVRYQAALRPEVEDYIAQLPLDRRKIDAGGRRGYRAAAVARRRFGLVFGLRDRVVVEAVARAADGEAFFVQQLADAADQQHFMVLVVAAVAAPLHRLELRELLLPVAEHVRLHPAQVAHFADGEVALGRDRRKLSFPAAWLHGAPSRPSPSASGWHGRSRRAAR